MSRMVRPGIAETIVHTWLTDFIECVHLKYRGIVIDIMPPLRESLKSGELEMAFLLAGPVLDANLVEKPLCRYPIDFIVSPEMG